MKKNPYRRKSSYLCLPNNKRLPLSIFISTVLISGMLTKESKAEDYFNPNALDKRGMQGIADVDTLSVFSKSQGQLPGEYSVDIYINNEFIGLNKVNFIFGNDEQLLPEVTKQQLVEWGVNQNSSTELIALDNETVITELQSYIPDATTKFDFTQQKLFINIPQAAMKATARGYISPELWDQGIPAFTLSYGFTGSKTWYDTQKDQHAEFLTLRSGLNMGAWRLRNYSVYSKNEGNLHWDTISTYLEKDVAFLRSQMTLGITNSAGDIFESFQFTGARLASDESMLPYSLRGFAPVVRGIAQSNAKVTIRQSGSIIYQTYVSAGPFEITDLYPTSTSGNLDVTVEELDGSTQTFVTPFSSVPIMQRDGQLKYSLSGGKYRANFPTSKEPNFIQSTLIYGLPWNTTLYGGGLYSHDYNALALGAGLNLGDVGAFSVDVTQAHTEFGVGKQSQYHGQSYRFQYAKNLLSSGTAITLAGYRYSTEGYYDFSEANDYYNPQTLVNKRSRMQANISQSLSNYGSIYLSGYQQNFWNHSGKEKTIGAGYNTSWNSITYGVNYTYSNRPGNQSSNQIFAFNFSVPLDAFLPNSRVNTNMSSDNKGASNMQLGISGNAMDNALSYNVQQSHGNKGENGSANAAIAYKGRNGTVDSGYSYSGDSQRLNYGVQGGLVLHSDGLTLAQSLGETLAIVRAPEAGDVVVQNAPGVSTDVKGYAVVPYLTPYQRNRVQLGVDSLSDNVDLVNSSASVVPTRGAIVWADFKTQVGWRALIKLHLQGSTVPFGSIATVIAENKSGSSDVSSGIVGDNGEVYLNGLPEKGRLLVAWGKRPEQQCEADFSLPKNKDIPVLQVISVCTIK
ncbi:fimbria/pilus outer membrane usher protein [Serratia fonticola]|uniref:fimbria/pilus outer membrane usher protein n=1 Tax=Serratia fonticola TaxID=47917 RepID=UPI003AF3AF8C